MNQPTQLTFDFTAPATSWTNGGRPPIVNGDVAIIPLTLGQSAVIDAIDLPLVEGRIWHASVKGHAADGTPLYYAQANDDTYLHRLLTDAPAGLVVDHRSGDTMDNRRANLRVVTHAVNLWNERKKCRNGLVPTSPFKGVSWHARNGCWQVHVRTGGTRRWAHFADETEAARWYNDTAVEVRGANARINVLDCPGETVLYADLMVAEQVAA